MFKQIIITPNDQIRDEVRAELKKQNVSYFDAVATKNAATEEESQKLGLTLVKPPENMDSVIDTQMRLIAGNHDTKELKRQMDATDIYIVSPESIRTLSEVYPENTFNAMVIHEDKDDIDANEKFAAIVNIESPNTDIPVNIAGAFFINLSEGQSSMHEIIEFLNHQKHKYKHVETLTERFINLGLLDTDEDGDIKTYTRNEDGTRDMEIYSKSDFVILQMLDEHQLNHMLATWLSFEQLKPVMETNHPRIVIIGRSGTGKTTLAKTLQEAMSFIRNKDVTLLKTTTTRPARPDEEDYHFISKEEAAQIPDEDKCLHTTIGEHEYFTTENEVKAAEIMILDPSGVQEVIRLLPDTPLFIIYTTNEETITPDMLRARGTTDEIQEQRKADENSRFDEFEKKLDCFGKYYAETSPGTIVTLYSTTYNLVEYARNIATYINCYRNLQCLFPVVAEKINMPEPTIEEVNTCVGKLMQDPETASEFMMTCIMRVEELPIDHDFKPKK